MTRHRAWAVLAVSALCATIAACGSTSEAPVPAAVTFETTEPSAGRVAIAGPRTVAAGVTEITLKNSGRQPHDAQIIRVDGDRTADEVISNTIDTEDGAPFPPWIVGGGGLGAVAPGRSATVTELLEPGTYYLLDGGQAPGSDEPNARRGGAVRFEVTGKASTAELPETDAVVTVRDYSFETSGIEAGPNRFTFENDGKQLHHMVAMPLADGATLDDAKEYLTAADEPTGRPPVDFGDVVSTAVIDGGQRQIAELDFARRRYALVCFVTNRDGGPTHLALGMINELDVR